MKRMKFISVFDQEVQLPHHCILKVKPDNRYSHISHIKTNFKDHLNKEIWFHVKHSYADVLDMYYEVKKNLGRR